MKLLLFIQLFSLLSVSACQTGSVSESKQHASMPDKDYTRPTEGSDQRDTATLGGGCFWCVEAIYQDLQGVHKVVSGYSGGTVSNPTYKEICTGTTGHAEVIQVIFDPAVVSYQEILEIFFTVHDPTTLNRQGNDVGTQYRSVIFYHSEEQKTIAEAVKKNAASIWDDPIVTEISALAKFYPAEDYHQNYYKDNPYQPYCAYIISPKVKKFREKFRDKLKQ